MSTEREVLLEVKDLHVTFGKGKKAFEAVRGVDFQVYKGETFGISEVIDWQFIAAFILITADEIYMIMPREIHMEIAPVLSEYTIPVLAVIGIMVAATIKVSITLYHKLADERRQAILQAQKIQQLLDSPPPEQKGISFLRKLVENQSIAQFSAKDYLLPVSYTHLTLPTIA